MLHYPNVDGLFAIWQTTYPNSYLSRTFASPGIATITPSDAINQDSPLTSFHSTWDGPFRTSSSARDIKASATSTPRQPTPTPPAPSKQSTTSTNLAQACLSTKPPPSNPPLRTLKRDGPQQPGLYYEPITNIRVAQNALDSNFTIFVSLGEFGNDPKTWLTGPDLVGSHTVFMPFPSEAQQDAGIVLPGMVPLTKELNESARAWWV
jgi:tyrosinase